MTYHWTQTAGPAVTLSSNNIANPTFKAPAFPSSTQLTFKLTVVNSKGVSSNPSYVTITVAPPVLPISNAGVNQQVQGSQTVHLVGSGSYDTSGFYPLTYHWTQTAGPTVTLSSNNIANPTFKSPASTTTNIQLTFELIVTNSKGVSSNPSYVTITVAHN